MVALEGDIGLIRLSLGSWLCLSSALCLSLLVVALVHHGDQGHHLVPLLWCEASDVEAVRVAQSVNGHVGHLLKCARLLRHRAISVEPVT